MIVKRIWKKGWGYNIKECTGYFLFGFIPLYISIVNIK